MRKILGAILLAVSIPVIAGQASYITVDNYFKLHPSQKSKVKSFEKIVSDYGRPIPTQLNKKTKIAFIYPGNQVSDYWRRSLTSFKKRMDEINVSYEVTEHFSRPKVDIREQEKQIRKALEGDPDYLVFTLDAKKHKRIIERILVRGRPKIILQNITTPLRRWEQKQPFLYVGFDHTLGSKELAEYYIEKTKAKGKYAVIFYTKGYVSDMRGKFFISYLKNNAKDLSLTNALYTDGSRASGEKAAMKIIKDNPDVKFIYACATDIALGAIDAIKKAKLKTKILVNGWGGGAAELESIQKKSMDVTVMRMNDDNGVAMAEAIKLDTTGKSEMIPQIYSGDFKVVDQKVSDKKINALKKQAFRYSN